MGKKKKNSYMRTRAFVSPFIKFFSNIKIQGIENIPEEGGYVLCSNHIAASDVLKLGVSCPRQLKFMAKKELFSIPILRGIMRAFGAVKLDRGGTDVAAIRSAIELAKSGDIVAIFPQGHRYPKVDPSTTPIKHGAALIAYRSGCGIIPACIKTKNNKYRIFKRVTVIFGKPIDNSALGFEKGDNEELRKATELVFSRILEMGEFGRLPSPKFDEERKN